MLWLKFVSQKWSLVATRRCVDTIKSLNQPLIGECRHHREKKKKRRYFDCVRLCATYLLFFSSSFVFVVFSNYRNAIICTQSKYIEAQENGEWLKAMTGIKVFSAILNLTHTHTRAHIRCTYIVVCFFFLNFLFCQFFSLSFRFCASAVNGFSLVWRANRTWTAWKHLPEANKTKHFLHFFCKQQQRKKKKTKCLSRMKTNIVIVSQV